MTEDARGRFRDELRDRMIQHAGEDDRFAAAALVGSAARQAEDAWSDIDLAIRLRPGTDLDQALADWSEWLTSEVAISDHLDVRAWGAVYRVFLCDNGLQIDLSLWPWEEFRATNGEPMKLLFGEAPEPEPIPHRDWTQPARMGWLYALHARSATYRGRSLQADLMLTSWREQIMALASVRLDLNVRHGREAHLLPANLQEALERARPARLTRDDLFGALARTAEVYLTELANHDADYANRLRGVFAAVTGP